MCVHFIRSIVLYSPDVEKRKRNIQHVNLFFLRSFVVVTMTEENKRMLPIQTILTSTFIEEQKYEMVMKYTRSYLSYKNA